MPYHGGKHSPSARPRRLRDGKGRRRTEREGKGRPSGRCPPWHRWFSGDAGYPRHTRPSLAPWFLRTFSVGSPVLLRCSSAAAPKTNRRSTEGLPERGRGGYVAGNTRASGRNGGVPDTGRIPSGDGAIPACGRCAVPSAP